MDAEGEWSSVLILTIFSFVKSSSPHYVHFFSLLSEKVGRGVILVKEKDERVTEKGKLPSG